MTASTLPASRPAGTVPTASRRPGPVVLLLLAAALPLIPFVVTLSPYVMNIVMHAVNDTISVIVMGVLGGSG
jgi:hypothetical protein